MTFCFSKRSQASITIKISTKMEGWTLDVGAFPVRGGQGNLSHVKV